MNVPGARSAPGNRVLGTKNVENIREDKHFRSAKGGGKFRVSGSQSLGNPSDNDAFWRAGRGLEMVSGIQK